MNQSPNNIAYAPGKHILLDGYGAQHLCDVAYIERALRQAADACGATILQVQLHQFGEEGGVTGVALLAESHISIHTWPETGFVALDIFMCGECDAARAIKPLTSMFELERFVVKEVMRGTD